MPPPPPSPCGPSFAWGGTAPPGLSGPSVVISISVDSELRPQTSRLQDQTWKSQGARGLTPGSKRARDPSLVFGGWASLGPGYCPRPEGPAAAASVRGDGAKEGTAPPPLGGRTGLGVPGVPAAPRLRSLHWGWSPCPGPQDRCPGLTHPVGK